MKYISIVLLLFLSACSVKNYKQETKIVIFKSEKIGFSDVAYIGYSGESVSIDLYAVGKALKKIEIDNMICFEDEGCMRKSSFNKEFLSSYYPDDLLQNVFLGRAIYSGKNLEKAEASFSQNIEDNNVDISYKVDQKQIYFKDRKNNILIKIKDVE